MKNNKGFIAISLIYSFFLVFLVVLLLIASNYAKNRILLSHVKNTTQEYLNGLSEFNPVSLENRTYTNKEEVKIGSEMWQVITDNGEDVSLMLKRSLTNSELKNGLSSSYYSAISGSQIYMCYSSYTPSFCSYGGVAYIHYTWRNSLVKAIVEKWLENDALLEKGVNIGNIVSMSYSDGAGSSYASFIRVPLASEYSQIGDSAIWYLTSASTSSSNFNIKIGSSSVTSYSTRKTVHPVITVKKSTPEPEEETSEESSE